MNVESKTKRNDKFPWLICGGDHFTKECPHRKEINKFLKNTSTPTMITYYFPTQQQLIDHEYLHIPSSFTEVKLMSRETVHVTTLS